MRAYEDAVRLVDSFLDRRAERIELCEARALLVGKQHPDGLEALAEAFDDYRAQVVQSFAGRRGDQQRARVPVRQPPATQGVDQIDLVQHELHRNVGDADLRQDVVDGGAHPVELVVGRGAVGHVQNEVGDERLLQRRGKTLDELVGQAADEADGVC